MIGIEQLLGGFMFNLFQTLDKIYTSRTPEFINNIDLGLSPVVINLMLSRNYKVLHVVKILNKYIYTLNSKKFVLLAWSLIQPKLLRAPFNKKIEVINETTRYDFLLDKIKSKLEISNNDWEHCKAFYLESVKENTKEYLVAYGCSKNEWRMLELDFDEGKEMNKTEIVEGLGKWF